MASIKPLNDLVIIEIIQDELEQTESGIFLPKTSTGAKTVVKGRVVAIGPGTTDISMDGILEGDEILVPSRAITTVEIDKKEYGAVVYRSIMCKLSE